MIFGNSKLSIIWEVSIIADITLTLDNRGYLHVQYGRWYEAIARRRSRRNYKPDPLEDGPVQALENTCHQFRPFEGTRAVLVRQPADRVFHGLVGGYGKIKGAPIFIAFIGDAANPNVNEQVGYTGEGIILEATALGLATCWVGGMFNEVVVGSLVGLNTGEKVLAVTPVGYPAPKLSFEDKLMAGFGRNYRRKPLSKLVSGTPKESWPEWVAESLATARLSPSAVNRQPWRFHVGQGALAVSVDGKDTYKISKRLDCGIAMLHIHVTALKYGVHGTWEFLAHPGVARFNSSAKT